MRSTAWSLWGTGGWWSGMPTPQLVHLPSLYKLRLHVFVLGIFVYLPWLIHSLDICTARSRSTGGGGGNPHWSLD